MKALVAGAVALMVSSCSPAYAVDAIEIKRAEAPAMCPVQGMPLPMPCAFAYALVQKIIGGGCGERTCPVKL